MNKLSPAMERALDRLTGAPNGKVRSTEKTVSLLTARALHRRGLAHLDTDFSGGRWEMVLIEPQTQEISDEQLQEMTHEEQWILTPLDPASRYRVRRHAHIRLMQSEGRGYSRESTAYTAVLHARATLTYQWKTGAVTGSVYSRDTDLAGLQWKAARSVPVNAWEILTPNQQQVMVLPGATREEARKQADALIGKDPVGYQDLTAGYGTRRLLLGELTGYLLRNGLAAL